MVLGFDLEAEKTVKKEVFGEEGEPELDMSDTITVNGLQDGSSKSSEKVEVEDAELPKPKGKSAVIRLVVGKKRKVEEEKVAELDVVQDEGKEEKVVADGAMILESQGKTEAPKRAARKKRKWLKKGEGEFPFLRYTVGR